VTQSPASKTNAFSVVMIDRLPKGKARETWRHKVMDLKSQRIFFVIMTARLPKSKSFYRDDERWSSLFDSIKKTSEVL